MKDIPASWGVVATAFGALVKHLADSTVSTTCCNPCQDGGSEHLLVVALSVLCAFLSGVLLGRFIDLQASAVVVGRPCARAVATVPVARTEPEVEQQRTFQEPEPLPVLHERTFEQGPRRRSAAIRQ